MGEACRDGHVLVRPADELWGCVEETRVDTVARIGRRRLGACDTPFPGSTADEHPSTLLNSVLLRTALGVVALTVLAAGMAAGRADATPFAYVGSQDGGSPSVKVIDTATDTVVATIPVDTAVGGVAVSPDGSRVYVTPYSIKVIDTSTNTVAATIPNLGTTYSPTVSPDGTRLYVGNNVCGGCDHVIQVIDTATSTQVDTWAAHGAANEMRINPTGTRLYVLHGSNEYITVIDVRQVACAVAETATDSAAARGDHG